MEIETYQEMRKRYKKAISKKTDLIKLIGGVHQQDFFSKLDGRHVFRFYDSMTMIIARGEINKQEVIHVISISNDAYKNTIKSEGLGGFVEDVILRFAAISGTMIEKSKMLIAKSKDSKDEYLHFDLEWKESVAKRGKEESVTRDSK